MIFHYRPGNDGEGVGSMKRITGVKENQVFAAGTIHALVHGIVYSTVGFGDDAGAARGE